MVAREGSTGSALPPQLSLRMTATQTPIHDAASTLTVQDSAQLVQVRVHARELDGDLVDRIHKILDHEDVVGIVLLRLRWRRGRGR